MFHLLVVGSFHSASVFIAWEDVSRFPIGMFSDLIEVKMTRTGKPTNLTQEGGPLHLHARTHECHSHPCHHPSLPPSTRLMLVSGGDQKTKEDENEKREDEDEEEDDDTAPVGRWRTSAELNVVPLERTTEFVMKSHTRPILGT